MTEWVPDLIYFDKDMENQEYSLEKQETESINLGSRVVVL